MAPAPHWNVQQIGTDGDAGGQQHGAPLDVVVAVQQADEGQVQEDARDHPEGDHRSQSPQSLCRGRQAIRDLPGTLQVPSGKTGGSPGHTGALPERCQPKVMVRVAGRVESQREKRLPIMLPTSASRWAASVIMARLCAKYPPARVNKTMWSGSAGYVHGHGKQREGNVHQNANCDFSLVVRLQIVFLSFFSLIHIF